MRPTQGVVALLVAALGLGAAAGVRAAAVNRPAPELAGGGPWFNTSGNLTPLKHPERLSVRTKGTSLDVSGGSPLTLAGLRGRVVLVEIWTGG
ncbi:MAG: hypothetical protein HY660_12490 [Armatimonadetes bacterium]|nr:hypothetical protein [Armatimonadota bacterium]